ncbi:DHA2 family efflux MFS transporter permease subunit [Sphingomonadaceae bacterium G21617-S1]|jgi:DHA2 family multidrug resistance protein|uniref:DHA2 family efflux MFS transporter permease subunit n=1 Tax=Rhizorhabdus sp. TaxID=1968843 RepID=UPI0019B5D835|nr:DHA2 family efflux MFS transporter permease subunit [Rhizorhabdus sp.]MBD3760250.1 DHA2 family efflux MFS transporter permease subunit [Rhizorhabdus sp.]MCZ4341006.1 DHA2 family efflux MFS transporter permease subunit [Sphingomonadaceae bacterium G21617-S1]
MGEEAIWTAVAGRRRLLATIALASANFMAMLDMSIANVSIPHISGNLGISPSQGTWVITSYAVAEAICVPLTGWLAQRFGTLRTFIFCVLGFALFSILCGLSVTLGMLVVSRIGQGICGGPMIPLTQTLLLRLYPPEKRGQAMGIWAMTTIIGPVLGPILGGSISDNLSWHWIFFINVPVAVLCAFSTYELLRPIETPRIKLPIDRVGIVLMVIWIGSLQIMLDIGREHDWFADTTVLSLGIVALVGLIVFIIWELTEEHPVVDLRVFRYRGFTVGTLTIAMGFSLYFAGIVVIPQWMQLSLSYTATQAGIATAATGAASMILARTVPKLMPHIDPRILLSGAFLWIGSATLLRINWTSGIDFYHLILPQAIMGIGMPFFFITATAITLGSVPPAQAASAAGLQTFVRTIGIAATTSIVMTYWNDEARVSGSELAGKLNTAPIEASLTRSGFQPDQIRVLIAQLVDKEALTLSTDKIFLIAGLLMWGLSLFVWLAPRPKSINVQGGH